MIQQRRIAAAALGVALVALAIVLLIGGNRFGSTVARVREAEDDASEHDGCRPVVDAPAGDDHDAAAGTGGRPSAAAGADDHRCDLSEVGRRDRYRARVRAEHDVPPHDDGVRRLRVVGEDDSGWRGSRAFRLPRSRRRVAGSAGRRRGEPRRQVLLRHQLLDVRRELRARRQRRVQRTRRSVAELRLPRRPEVARDRRGRSGRHGAEVHRGHARQPLHPRDQLVLVRPQRRRPGDLQGGPPHPARDRSARHRREPRLAHRVHRGYGLERRRAPRPRVVRAGLVPRRRPLAAPRRARRPAASTCT